MNTNSKLIDIFPANDSKAMQHSFRPSPFTDQAVLQYTLPIEGKVTLEIYKQFGQLVRTLVDEHQTAGLHSTRVVDADVNGADIYIYRLRFQSPSGITDLRGTIIMTT